MTTAETFNNKLGRTIVLKVEEAPQLLHNGASVYNASHLHFCAIRSFEREKKGEKKGQRLLGTMTNYSPRRLPVIQFTFAASRSSGEILLGICTVLGVIWVKGVEFRGSSCGESIDVARGEGNLWRDILSPEYLGGEIFPDFPQTEYLIKFWICNKVTSTQLPNKLSKINFIWITLYKWLHPREWSFTLSFHPSLKGFHFKTVKPRISSWFDWNKSCRYVLMRHKLVINTDKGAISRAKWPKVHPLIQNSIKSRVGISWQPIRDGIKSIRTRNLNPIEFYWIFSQLKQEANSNYQKVTK